MEIYQIIILFIAGLVLMIKSADFFVNAAVKIAELSGIPKLIVGATLVSLATTLPELFVSSTAMIEGKNEMAIGNALGSVIFNTAIILSIAALFMSGKVDRKNVMEKAYVLVAALITLMIFGYTGSEITLLEGIIQLMFVVLYTYLNIISSRKQKILEEEITVENKKKAYIINFIILIVSAVGIRFGADFLIKAATAIAERSGVSDAIIGLTILAMGTSLPELATTVTAILKKEQSLSIGNVLGANILNVTLIMGISSFISQIANKQGLPITSAKTLFPFINVEKNIAQTLAVDLPFILAIILLFTVPIFFKGRLSKWQGVVGLALYGIYLTFLLFNA